ncbi:Hypothetical protein, putative, partial [Bodo saltans]
STKAAGPQQQQQQRRTRFATNSNNDNVNVHDISNATSASLPSNHQMFSSVAKSRPPIPSPVHRAASGGGRTSNPLNSYGYEEEDEEDPPSHNVSHDALDMERVRMENSRADKLFNSPFVEDVRGETGGNLHQHHHSSSHSVGIYGLAGSSMMMAARNLRSPQTPMSVSYIHEPSPMTPSGRGNITEEDEAVRSVVERLTFQSAVKNTQGLPSSHRLGQQQRQQQLPTTTTEYDNDNGEEEDYPPDDEDLHAYMLETLRDAMRGGSNPRSA